MAALAHQCLRHPERPAAARCPSCRQSYCRECVVEHEHRLVCADCLRRMNQPAAPARKRRWVPPVAPFFQAAAALLVVFLAFYVVADLLQRIPADLHEGLTWGK